MVNDPSQQNRSLTTRPEQPPTTIAFGPSQTIDLSGLSPAKREQLLADHIKGMLDLSQTATELGTQVDALRATLNGLGNTASEMVNKDISVTMTHSTESKLGRTEIIIGTTEEAKRGRLSLSQSGRTDFTPWYVGGGLLALVLIAALLGAR